MLFDERRNYPEPLKESVGNNQPNLGEDLRKIKRGLSALGIIKDDTSEDFITRALDTGIKVFQKDNGLKIDGILRPGGETERGLFETLTRRPSEELFGPDPMKSTGIGIGFGTGISTLDQLQEAAQKSGGHVFTYVKPREDKPSPSNGIIKNLQGRNTSSQPRDIFSTPKPEEQLTPTKQQEINEDTSPVQYDATGRMISPTQSEKKARKKESSVSLPAPAEKKSNRTYSNTNLEEHYKRGTGALVTITPEEMNNVPVFKDGIAKNRNSFEQSIVTGKVKGDAGTFDSPFKEKIENMKDGETIILDKNKPGKGDYWDQDIKTRDFLMKGDITGALALGDVKLRSEGQLKAERNGDKIYITGNIDHKVHNEEYNFNAEDWALKHWRDMEKKGAKPFPIKGNRKDKVEGVLTIKGGKIIDQNFKWIPADQGR